MSTLVAAMAEDPVSAYFSGNNCIRFVKEEVCRVGSLKRSSLKLMLIRTHLVASPRQCLCQSR